MWEDLKKYLNPKQPIFQVLTFLKVILILSVVDLFIYEPAQTAPLLSALALVVCTTLMWYWVAKFLMGQTGLNLMNLTISAIIVFLLVHPGTPLWLYPVTLLFTFGLKSVIRYKGQPVFNPAAFGLLAAYIFTVALKQANILDTPLFVSWWGADVLFTFAEGTLLQWIVPLALFGGFLFAANRFRKLLHALFFIGTYLMAYIAYSGNLNGAVIWGLLMSSLSFMAFIMVTEPKTSPVQQTQQIVLGIIGGFYLFLFYNYFPEHVRFLSFSVGDLIALLLLNLTTFGWKQYETMKRTQKTAIGAPESAIPAKTTPTV